MNHKNSRCVDHVLFFSRKTRLKAAELLEFQSAFFKSVQLLHFQTFPDSSYAHWIKKSVVAISREVKWFLKWQFNYSTVKLNASQRSLQLNGCRLHVITRKLKLYTHLHCTQTSTIHTGLYLQECPISYLIFTHNYHALWRKAKRWRCEVTLSCLTYVSFEINILLLKQCSVNKFTFNVTQETNCY